MPFQKGNPGGPGRPRKKDKFSGQIAAAEQQIVDRLPALITNLQTLADGGYERVEEQWVPARLVTIGAGELAFPNLPPDQLVCVKRTVTIADRDRASNQYLIDRIMGKPTERREHSGHIDVSKLTDAELDAILNDSGGG